MKSIKILIACFSFLALSTGCEEDEVINYAFEGISAPQNVTANFEVTQDDSGVVNITPVGEGASTFTIQSGQQGVDPVTVNVGESASFTYEEGEYPVRITAMGPTGLTSEYNQLVVISFTTPENLAFETNVSGLTATVTPTADNAMMFEVYFGVSEDEEPVVIMAGQSANFEYAEAGTYDIRVVAIAASVETIELTKSVVVAGAIDPIVLPVTFDDPDVNYDFQTFNGASFEVVTNPDQTGANPEETNVGAITNAGAQFEGGAFNLGTPVDFSGSDKTITMKFWSTSETSVLLKFEGGVNDERQTEVSTTHGGTGWEVLSFDFATDAIKSFIDGNQGVGEPFVPTGQYGSIVIFIDGPGTLSGTFYIDDIEQTGLLSPRLPITYDEDQFDYTLGTFNGASFGVVTNPDLSGENTEPSQVGAITNSGNNFEGGAYNLSEPVDFSSDDKTIQFKFWSDVEVPVLLKFEGGANGERQTEISKTHGGTGWETLSFDFATEAIKSFIDSNQGVGEPFVPTGQYGTVVLFVDGPGTTAGTFFIDDIEKVSSALRAPSLPITFDDAGVDYTLGVFNNASFEVVVNPDLSGANAEESLVGAITNSGTQFEGGAYNLATPVDFSGSNQTIAIKVWSQTALPVLLKFEGGVNGERQNEVVAQHGGTGWETLTFDFATDATKSFIDGNQGVGESFVPSGQYATLVLFVDGPGTTSGTFYIDDIIQQ
ncbi:MAG: hypothetical protein WBG71_12935 [Leeuwenhoekiella sp.]